MQSYRGGAQVRLHGTASDDYIDNLPPQPTALIGRERELAALQELVLRDGVRLVTLVGEGGVGKTRLAIETAERLLFRFPDGVSFVDLAAISDPHLVPSAIAKSLGLREMPSQPLFQGVKHALDQGPNLLILDNFEQVTPASKYVLELLLCCPGLKIVVTSREALSLRWEYRFQVPPLGLPDLDHLPAGDALMQYPAVALFVERAQATLPDFKITEQNGAAVAEICARLDGLPLAIELAAARINVFTCQSILELLQRRLDFLVAGPRDLPERQQTLRETIAWSYNLLPDGERVLFQRLGVFAGGCTIEAASAVCQTRETDDETLMSLSSLVDRSLLRQEGSDTGQSRFRMLDTMREYAIEQLASGSGEEVRDVYFRHASYFLDLAQRADKELHGPEQQGWLAMLEMEHDNIQAAIARALAERREEVALKLCAAMWYFWFIRSHFSEGRHWLEKVLSLNGEVPDRLRADCLMGAGMLAHAQADFEKASDLLETGLDICRSLQDKQGTMRFLNCLGLNYEESDDYEMARRYLEESLALARESGDKTAVGATTNNLGNIALDHGDYTTARRFHEESLSLCREIGDLRTVAVSLGNLSGLARLQNDLKTASEYGKEALETFRDLGYRLAIPPILGVFAMTASAGGKLARAAHLFAASEALADSIGAPVTVPNQRAFAPDLAATRAGLSQKEFDAAWAAGSQMGLDEAIAFALDPMSGEPAPNNQAASTLQRSPLTSREREIATLVALGRTNQEIAEELIISRRTVDAHIANILGKLDFTSRAQVAAWAVENGLARGSHK